MFSMMCLSDTWPPHPLDTKLIMPCGVILIRYFAVLYCDQVQDFARRFKGFSIKSSKQSMMATTLRPYNVHENKMALFFVMLLD